MTHFPSVHFVLGARCTDFFGVLRWRVQAGGRVILGMLCARLWWAQHTRAGGMGLGKIRPLDSQNGDKVATWINEYLTLSNR